MRKLKKRIYSVKHFYGFLDEARRRDVLSAEKLHKWRVALREFQSVMRPCECDDLRCIDIEGVSKRYLKRVSEERISITPWLIHTRKKHLQNAIGNFVAYAINPLKYCDSMSGKSLPTPHYLSADFGTTTPPRPLSHEPSSARIR